MNSSAMYRYSIGRTFIIATIWISLSIGFQDYDMIKFDLQQLSDVPVMGSLKMFRAEHRDYKFNVTLNITTDDLSIYDVEATLYRSSMGNNQFVLSPFKIPRKPLCDCFNKEFRDRVMDDLVKYSNLPCDHDPNVNYCDLLKKGNQYEVINYIGNVSSLPKYTATGTYKFVGSIIDRNTNAVALSVVAITKLY